MGTLAKPVSKPCPCCSSQRIAPLAASRPKALPPASMTASIFSTSRPGAMASVSRVPGPPPRTSTPATAPFSKMTAVTPVRAAASVACPTRTPVTSVMLP